MIETWEKLKFDVLKYTKGTQDRGFILGAVDEIIQALDDNTMSLQSMSASRFVGPFLNTVQSWEKSLSLISEVIDVSRNSVYCMETFYFDEFCIFPPQRFGLLCNANGFIWKAYLWVVIFGRSYPKKQRNSI